MVVKPYLYVRLLNQLFLNMLYRSGGLSSHKILTNSSYSCCSTQLSLSTARPRLCCISHAHDATQPVSPQLLQAPALPGRRKAVLRAAFHILQPSLQDPHRSVLQNPQLLFNFTCLPHSQVAVLAVLIIHKERFVTYVL